MTQNTTLSVSILSGKGGVGKTNIALNLGYCLYRGGHPLLLMDCDLGLANLDVLLGIAPDRNMQDLLDSDAAPRDIAVPIEQGGFDFLPAASGVPELVEMDGDMRALLVRKLEPLFSNYDFLFLDLGAGINPTVLAFAAMTQLRIVIVTPEPTSLTDSYALMKVLSTQHGVRDFFVIVNQAESRKEETQTFERLAAACRKFLDIEPQFLGGVRLDKALPDAVRKQKPLMRVAPQSPAAQDLFSIAVKLQRMRSALLPELADRHPLRALSEEAY
ncbi:MinD/ParA family protein [Nitratidesulfovibrio liaohensis]|uniref:MinD/ParA family protein n=1 Tax=Nitratidesulfovibrio liaohensis TaxID=2604158 RepID=A0ABY9R302_9BACT|nr:MinD/ParA family protein [Nitratidesulfovibrio liaohensis]WMW66128.1 MinD/ParA family protein [Nitratidesulfovibrio liaohensis]